MAGKKQLPPVRVVSAGDVPADVTVLGSVSRLQELRAMRRVLAAHVDSPNTLARDLAALVRQLRDISKEIDELDPPEAEVSVNDDGNRSDSPFKLQAI